jgi:hypothetical protein
MKLILGPNNLSVDFNFTIEEANKLKNIDFDSIGVYFSGGIDSTALLLIILTELKNTDRLKSLPVKCFTICKKDFSLAISTKIIKLIEKKFDIKIEHNNFIPNYLNSQENIRSETIQDLCAKNKNTLFFMGINKMPENDLVSFKHKLKIDYGNEKDKIVFYSPFLYLHKPQIIDIFYKLNCEDLLPYTYSCTIKYQVPCNNCYACEERKWGFDLLKKNDPLNFNSLN